MNPDISADIRRIPSWRSIVGLSLAVLGGAGLHAQTAAPAAPRSTSSGPRLDAITDQEIRADVQFLASDQLEGRAPSTRGGSLAAQYVATRFKLLGLAPGGEHGTYFQQVTVVESKVDASAGVTVSGGTGAPERLTPTEDVVAWTGVEDDEVNVDADVVFVGYGINAPEQTWNDYAGVDVHGKVVMMMVNDPPATPSEPNLFGGVALTYYGRWTYKFEEAARQGAAGVILIHTTESASYPFNVVQTAWTGAHYSLPVESGQPTLKLKSWVTDGTATAHRRAVGTQPRRPEEGRCHARVQGRSAWVTRRDHDSPDAGPEGIAERDRRGSRTQPLAGRHLHGALRPLRHTRPEAG